MRVIRVMVRVRVVAIEENADVYVAAVVVVVVVVVVEVVDGNDD